MPRLLVELRGRLRQADAGALVGLPQHRISRAEQGRYPLTPDEADRYARALGATPIQRRRLVALAAAHTTDSISGRKHLLRNAHQVQRRIGDLETANKLIRSWVPDVVTGVLQTREYTLALVSEQMTSPTTSGGGRRVEHGSRYSTTPSASSACFSARPRCGGELVRRRSWPLRSST